MEMVNLFKCLHLACALHNVSLYVCNFGLPCAAIHTARGFYLFRRGLMARDGPQSLFNRREDTSAWRSVNTDKQMWFLVVKELPEWVMEPVISNSSNSFYYLIIQQEEKTVFVMVKNGSKKTIGRGKR